MAQQGSTQYLYAFDGNGNVSGVMNRSSGTTVAEYEYSPFGELLRCQTLDPTVADQPFRFSTKYYDGETGLYDYGHRYYDPRNGRFLGRDPIEEQGGLNLYGFCGNDGVDRWDILGQMSRPPALPRIIANPVEEPPIPLDPVVVSAPTYHAPTLPDPISAPTPILQNAGPVNTGTFDLYTDISVGGIKTIGSLIVDQNRKLIDDYIRTGDSAALKRRLRQSIAGNWKSSPNADKLLDDFCELVKYGGVDAQALVIAALSYPIQPWGTSSISQLVINDVPGGSPGKATLASGAQVLYLDLSKSMYGLKVDDETPNHSSIILGHELGHLYYGYSDPTVVVVWENLLRSNYNAAGLSEDPRQTYGGTSILDHFNPQTVTQTLPSGRTVTYTVDTTTYNFLDALPLLLRMDYLTMLYRTAPTPGH